MKKTIFKGCGTALATPFTDDNKINYDCFEKFLNFQLENHVDSLIVCGTTGESATLSDDEKKQLIKYTVDKVSHKVPVIAGTGSNNTSHAIELSQYAEKVGADALLLVTPYYNKTTQNGLIKHYETIAKNTSLPIILYNVPSRTGVNVLPETCAKLAQIENIVAIKEASGDISQIAKTKSLCSDDFSIYSGNDDQIVPIMSLGGIGVISVLSNIYPKYTHNICHEFFNGNLEKSKKLQLDALPLINSLFCEVNPSPVKYALNSLGFNFGKPRLPLVEPNDTNKKLIKEQLTLINP